MKRTRAQLVVTAFWLAVLRGLTTNMVSVGLPPFLARMKPVLWLCWLLVGAVGMFVELRRNGPFRPLGDPEPKRHDRTAALRRIRASVDGLLTSEPAGLDPLTVSVEGADAVLVAYETDESPLVLCLPDVISQLHDGIR